MQLSLLLTNGAAVILTIAMRLGMKGDISSYVSCHTAGLLLLLFLSIFNLQHAHILIAL